MKELEMNPYVIQIDRFVSSLDKLSKAFLDLDEKKSFFFRGAGVTYVRTCM